MRPSRLGRWWIVPVAILAGTNLLAEENLLCNPGLEQGLDGWWTFGEGWHASNGCGGAESAHGGATCAVNEIPPGSTNDEWRGICQAVTVKPCGKYAFSAWIMASGTSPSESYLEVQFFDQFDRIIQCYQSQRVTSDQPFTDTVVNNVQAPAKTVKTLVRGVVHLLGPAPTGVTVHAFDDFEFRRKSDK